MKLFQYSFLLVCAVFQVGLVHAAGATSDYDVTLKDNRSSISLVLYRQLRIEGFSFCLWFRLFEEKGRRVLVSLEGLNNTVNNSISLIYHNPTVMQLQIADQSVDVPVPELFTGEWHHTCAAWNTTNGRWLLMLDGEIQQSCSGLTRGWSIHDLLKVNLGKSNDSSTRAIDESFRGQMSSFYFWDYEILIRDMRGMFETCQPEHDTNSTIGWGSFWGNLGKISSTPSRCHKKNNLARASTTIPLEAHPAVVDGSLSSSCYATAASNKGTVEIVLERRALIAEVFISLGFTSAHNVQIELLVFNDGAPTRCGSVQDMTSDKSGVVYCNKPLNGTELIISYSLPARESIKLCEVLIFGEYDGLLPIAIFPLSNTSQQVTEFKGENFQDQQRQNIIFGSGVAGEKYGSSVFEAQSKIEFTVDKDRIASLFSSGSFTMSAWINIHEYTANAHIVGFITSRSWQSPDPTRMSLIDSTKVTADFGPSLPIKLYFNTEVTVQKSFNFQKNFWYHLAMTYDGESSNAFVFRDEEILGSVSSTPLAIQTSNEFRIGSGFIGKIACVQLYDQTVHPFEVGSIFYRCLESGQPVSPPPFAFFPFSSSQTLRNVMDPSMTIDVSGALATSSFERTGVLNEPYKAVRFSSDTINELRLISDPKFQPKFAMSVFSWIMMAAPVSNTFFKHNKLKLKINKNFYCVELEYGSTDGIKYSAQGTTRMLTKRWYFISFSFRSVKGGSVLLELDGQVEYQEQNIAAGFKSVKLFLEDKIVLGHNLDGKMACVQVYDAWLTTAQRTMVKHKCMDEEGIYQMPAITSVSLLSPLQAVVSWKKIDYPLRGLIQGYRVTYSTPYTDSWSIVSCNESSTVLNDLETGLVYNVSVQAFRRQDGPKSQHVNITIPREPISPPTNITATSTGTSSIRLTWDRSTDPVLGYYAFIQPLGSPTAGNISVMLCSNLTTYEFQGLTAMTEYLVKVDGMDGKEIGTTGQTVTAKTDEEAPVNKPYNVRVLKITYGIPCRCIYITWKHRVSLSLRGILRGFTIAIWPSDGNESQAKNYSVFHHKHHKIYDLHLNTNYTAVVYPFTTRVGPASDPVMSMDEEAIKVPPAYLFGSVDQYCSRMKLRWYHPQYSLTFGLVRDYRVTYYSYTEGPQAARHVIVGSKSLNVTNIILKETYAVCVAARSLPDTPFGPCTDTMNITINCNTPRAVSEWNSWTVCSQSCGGGIRSRSRTCFIQSCSSNLDEIEYCNTKHCPDIDLEANFTGEVWHDDLVDNRSSHFKELESKIRQNVELVYKGRSDLLKGVKLIKSWQGSVMASVNIGLSSSISEEILILQEWIDINGTIGSLPVISSALYSYTVAGKGPNITSLTSITSTSAQVTWSPVDVIHHHGNLQGYRINYRQPTSNTWQSTKCTNSCLSTVVDGLESTKTYRFRVQAITGERNGIGGPASVITIPELASSASPSPVNAAALSSTVVSVEWSPIPLDQISGSFLGYRVMFTEEATGIVIQRTASSWIDWMMVDNLKKFTWYLVRVIGFSDQGPSASSEVLRVRTFEDVPSAPPSSVVVHDMRDSSTIDIQWSPVPTEHRHGMILGYKLTCLQDTNSPVFSKTYSLSPATNKFTLRNLSSSTSYKFELLAFTSKGDGAVTKFTGATCNCERDVYTNWRYYPPYVSNDGTGIPAGIFGPVVKDMILTACGMCTNGHGRSVIHFSTNGKGKPAEKESHYDVISDIDDVTDVSFPVRGFVGETKFMKYYSYVSLIDSPGTAFLTVRKDETTSRDSALYNTLSDCWPVVILGFEMALLAGILVWFLDCRSNPDQSSPSFLRGAWEGLWFCYISMTTVGYGDRVPVTIAARIVSLVWTLTGLSIISICMALFASSLTVVVTSIDKQVILYGTKVSAVENSSEYRIGLLKNAKMSAHPSLTFSYQALGNGEVDGVLVDAYVAGSLQDITPVNTYVNRIVNGGAFTYGVVLSGRLVRLQEACTQYLQMNKATISNLIKRNVKALKSSSSVASNNSETSAQLRAESISQPSVSVWDYIIYFLVVLGVCICCGVAWEAYFCLKIRKENKLKQELERITACAREVIKEFHGNCNATLCQLRQKHVTELKMFCKMKEKRDVWKGKSPSPKI